MNKTLILAVAALWSNGSVALAASDVGADPAGSISYVVEGRATGDLRAARPGDRITITVRDEATGRRQAITAVVSGAMNGPVSEPTPERTVVFKEPGTAVEFVNLDPATRNITVIGETGERQIFHVADSAYLRLSEVKPGQKVFLSYRFDAEGKAEALVRVAPSVAPPRATLTNGWTGDVVSTDVAAKSITIRTGDGRTRTLAVNDGTLRLEALEPGERVVVGSDTGEVIVIRNR